MSIRTVLTWSICGLLSVATLVAVGLAGFTVYQHQELSEWRSAGGGIQIGEEIELGLLRLNRLRQAGQDTADSRDERTQLERDMRQHLAAAAADASGDPERQIVAKASQQITAYLDSRDPRLDDHRLTLALTSLGELVAFNVAEADVATRQIGRSTRIADAIAAAAAALLLIGTTAMLLWLRTAAFTPLFELRGVIERFAGGDPGARARDTGPAEIVSIGRAFNSMADQLASYRRRQMAFLAGVAHDLRAPLAPLKAAAAMGCKPEILRDAAQTKRLFEIAARQVDCLERMTLDLLEAARIEGGHLQLRLERCDLRALASAASDLFIAQEDSRRILLAVPDDPVVVRCDQIRIQQVLTNLVGNAIKYSPPTGAVSITVTHEDGEACLAIADQGAGIPRDEIEHIFEPFRRGHSMKDAVPGVGLGLATSRRLVQMHGGRLEVASQPGAGSTFIVRLPAEKASSQPVAQTVH